jgi:predicted AAA+ superfamily ATPase
MHAFSRSLVALRVKELEKRQPVFQVLTGPRQVGKTTIAQQVINRLPFSGPFFKTGRGVVRKLTWPSE